MIIKTAEAHEYTNMTAHSERLVTLKDAAKLSRAKINKNKRNIDTMNCKIYSGRFGIRVGNIKQMPPSHLNMILYIIYQTCLSNVKGRR